MIVLGIETSCDETSAGLLHVTRNQKKVLANIAASQLAHSRFGGVVPEIAARAHIQLVVPITKLALEVAKKTFRDIDLVAVTRGPGLLGALLVGLSFAKAMSLACRIPFIGVNHLEGHLLSINLDHPDLEYPYLSLIISGGHTELTLVRKKFGYRILGSTLDDACGEAFDKVAKMLNLPYPGGPYVEQLARQGREEAVGLPVPRVAGYDFSFSGLKTAVLHYIKQHRRYRKPDVCARFQRVVADHLLEKATRAALKFKCRSLGLTGGVSANQYLRERMTRELGRLGIKVLVPSLGLSTDNAAMVAYAGYERFQKFGASPLNLPAFARFEGF